MPATVVAMIDAEPDRGGNSLETEYITEAVVGDGATSHDRLGFDGYVKAVARFLTAYDTLPPLTISIEGEWGSGKSSFMLMLQDVIGKLSTPRRTFHLVRFNAWRYDKNEALWAAFALNFIRALRPNLTRWQAFRANTSLLRQRLDFEAGALRIYRTAGMLLAILALGIFFVCEALRSSFGFSNPAWYATAVIYAGIVVAGFRKAYTTIGSPFEHDLKRYFDSPDYRGNRAFIETFQDDFARIVKAYTNAGDRIFVFIDDLDRCEIPRAADLLQALNLLMSGENLPIVYVLGIDREVVAAGIAAKVEKQAPYLFPDVIEPAAKLAPPWISL